MSVGDENSVATFRVVVLGAARAGKTSIIRRFLYDEFSERYHETIEDIHRMNFIVKVRATAAFFAIACADMHARLLAKKTFFGVIFTSFEFS